VVGKQEVIQIGICGSVPTSSIRESRKKHFSCGRSFLAVQPTPLSRIVLAFRSVSSGRHKIAIVLRGVLKRAKRWHLMADDIRLLPLRESVERALAYDEKLRLLKIADGRPEWVIARLAMALALNTTMRACEIRGLHWRDVNFIERTISVQRNTTKTDAGERAARGPQSWNNASGRSSCSERSHSRTGTFSRMRRDY